MVVVVRGPEELDLKVLSCWHTNDPLLSNHPVVVFLGPSAITNVTQSSSRIQVHVFSIAGFQQFPRLTINPGSQQYAVVDKLPDDLKGNEIRRGLAIGLFQYFEDMPSTVKQNLLDKWTGAESQLQLRIFDLNHAASLASKMTKVSDPQKVATYIASAMAERSLSWVDLDVVLPTGSISVVPPEVPAGRASLLPLPDTRSTINYGKYQRLLDLLGDSTFLPTSRLRRAPSKPTAVSRTRVLDSGRKESLKREMRELVTTEANYVSKLQELVSSIAARESAVSGDRVMQSLFPPSLRAIVQVNEEFSQRLQGALEEDNSGRDPTGALSFAKIMLEFFPKLKDPYQDYLRVGSNASKLVSDILRDKASSQARAIAATGEQKLRSWLIEPVQRLPRYNLFIDSMTGLLPAEHPAMSRFLAARDIVTDICSLDNEGPEDNTRTVHRLRNIVDNWSESFMPSGRLVTAVDCNELQSPYLRDQYGRTGTPTVLLLFLDVLVIVDKVGSVSARGVLAEVDRSPAVPSIFDSTQAEALARYPFTFRSAISLSRTRFTESLGSRLLNIAYTKAIRDASTKPGAEARNETQVFQLLGPYEGKAAKFTEEVALARIEYRYPDTVRDSDSWALRTTRSDEIGLICAISSVDAIESIAQARLPMGKVRINLDNCMRDFPANTIASLSKGVELVVNLNLPDDDNDNIIIETNYRGRHVSTVTVGPEKFFQAFTKGIASLQRLQYRPIDPEASIQSIEHARGLGIALEHCLNPMKPLGYETLTSSTATKRLRPTSPVKTLANMFGGSTDASSGSIRRFGGRARADTTKSVAPPVLTTVQSQGRPMSYYEPAQGQGTLESHVRPDSKDPILLLEETLASYIIALQTRKGNIVGRTLQNRKNADEATVNELYNILIQDPSQLQFSAEVSTDELFASFEKFLHTAWKARLGPIISAEIAEKMQQILFSGEGGWSTHFKVAHNGMIPQNRNAFTQLIALLSDLVGATANDSDRGTLVATFAEILLPSDDQKNRLLFFDRLLADADVLLEIKPPEAVPKQNETRARATGTGSITSAASSVGKKLGWFALNRGNSKSGKESKINLSLWSKSRNNANADEPTTPPSLSRSLLSRTRSTDTRPTTPRSPSLSRPGSSYSNQTQENSRPGSAHGLITQLAPIGEKAVLSRPLPRRKRRSSLSDVPDRRTLDEVYPMNIASPPPRNVDTDDHRNMAENRPSRPLAIPRRPVLQKSPSSSGVLHRGRPIAQQESAENVLQSRNMNRPTAEPRVRATKSPTPSGIPILRQELPQLLATPQLSPTKAGSRRLRVQSPQKLRERLDREKTNMQKAGFDLQAEIDNIGKELINTQLVDSNPQAQITALTNRVAEMEQLLITKLDALGSQADDIHSTLKSSLEVSEKKSRKLDILYNQATQENDALYARANEEMQKFANKMNSGSTEAKVEEIKRQWQIAKDEAAALRRDNARLKRENLGLKAQLRDG